MSKLPEIVCVQVVHAVDGHEEFVPLLDYIRNPEPGTYISHPSRRPSWLGDLLNSLRNG